MLGIEPTLDGFAVGDYRGRAVIHRFIEGVWQSVFCQSIGSTNPSRFYSVDVIESTGTAWVGGYYTSGKKVAYLGSTMMKMVGVGQMIHIQYQAKIFSIDQFQVSVSRQTRWVGQLVAIKKTPTKSV